MENKFKKAAEQRFKEEEHKEQKNSSLEQKSSPVKSVNKPIKKIPAIEENLHSEDNITVVENISHRIDDIISTPELVRSKNKTYYLEEEVINKIVQLAKAKKTSESKIVNDILKHILR
jgi:hypothetical protein